MQEPLSPMMPALCCRRKSLLSRYWCPSPRIPQQVRLWGEQVSSTQGTQPPEGTLSGPGGDAWGLHFELIIGEKASMRHGSISTREKPPVAAGPRDHLLFVLLNVSSGVLLPQLQGCSRNAPGSAPQHPCPCIIPCGAIPRGYFWLR